MVRDIPLHSRCASTTSCRSPGARTSPTSRATTAASPGCRRSPASSTASRGARRCRSGSPPRSPTRSWTSSSPTGVLVMIEAEHLCMSMRGVEEAGLAHDHLGGARALQGQRRDPRRGDEPHHAPGQPSLSDHALSAQHEPEFPRSRRLIGRAADARHHGGLAVHRRARASIATFGSLPAARGRVPRLVRADRPARSGSRSSASGSLMRIALHTDAWFDVACVAARRATRSATRCPGGAATGGATHVSGCSCAPGYPTATTTHRAHRGRAPVDRHAVRAPAPRVAGDPVRARGELGAAAAARSSAAVLAHLPARRRRRSCSCPTASSAALGHALRLGRCTACCAEPAPSPTPWPIGCVESRDVVRSVAEPSRGSARCPASLGNQLFDFLALYVSLLAVGAHVEPDPRAARVRRRPARWR